MVPMGILEYVQSARQDYAETFSALADCRSQTHWLERAIIHALQAM